MALQRVRVKYGRKGPIKFISHLDMMRMWQRAFRRAGVPVARSEGSMPRPKFSLAAPLPVGVTADAELMDVYLNRRLSPFYLIKKLSPQLPAGIEVTEANDIPLEWPSLQSQVQQAEYRVTVETDQPAPLIEKAIRELLDKQTLPWEHRRDTEVRRYDLRAQVHDLWLESSKPDEAVLGMTLKTDPSGSGRPEQVAAALGLPAPPKAIHRTRLVLAAPPKKALVRR